MNDDKLIQFYRETGIWPNGKDRSPMMHQHPETELFDVKAKAYKLWEKLKAENERLKKLVDDLYFAFGFEKKAVENYRKIKGGE